MLGVVVVEPSEGELEDLSELESIDCNEQRRLEDEFMTVEICLEVICPFVDVSSSRSLSS